MPVSVFVMAMFMSSRLFETARRSSVVRVPPSARVS